MNEEEILQQAQAALRAGKSADGVNARIAELSGGRYRDLRSLQLALRMAGAMPGAAAQDTTDPNAVSTGSPSPVRDYLRAAAQGATFGFADEIAGALPGGDAEASRARMARIRQERPVGSFVAETAGGLLIPGASGAAVGRAVVGRGGSRLAAGFLGGGAVAGATGALTGAGEAAPGNRIAGAVMGNAVGGVTGAAGGLAAAGLGRAINRAAGHTGEMAEFARTRIRQALELAGVDPEDLMAHLSELGEGSVVADLGDNLGREARAAVNQAPSLASPGGPQSRIITRQMETGDRLSDQLRRAARLDRTFEESLAEAEQLTQEVREQFYRPLEARYPAVSGENVAAVLQDPTVARVARRVSPEIGKRPPSFRELQDIMLELRDEMTAARASGRPNRSKRSGEVFDQLMDAIEQDVPDFAPAQAAYRIAIRREGAHELGQKFAFKNPRDIQQELGRLPVEAQDAFRMGMLDRWETTLRETPSGGRRATAMIFGGRTSRDRIRAIVADDAAMAELLNGMEREQRWQATYRALRGNSTTAQQQNDVANQVPQSVRAATWKIVTGIFGLSPQQRMAAAEMIGRTLMAEGPEAARRMADDMRIRFSRPGAAGAILGTTGAREISTSRGGLLDD